MLLDPLEEQLDLPALLVECRDFLSAALEIIGDQYQVGLFAVAADPNTAHILPEIVVGPFGVEVAKSVLRDEVLLSKCINEVKWFHTHNLKYPDIRVSHQRLISKVVSEDIAGICSRSLPLSFGWSHNSAEINHAKLFLTSFSWQGEVTCLAKFLITEEPVWINLIRAYGFTKKAVLEIAGKIKQLLPVVELPLEVSSFSPQLQMPFQQSYLAVTPVVSHAILAKINSRLSC